METTLEVRWFAEGRPPPGLTRRLDAVGGAGPQSRTDCYLRVPGAGQLGIKLRNGGDRFEVKLRDQDLGDTRFSGGVRGRLERWQKWSFPVDGPGGPSGGLTLPPGSWVEVEKHRRLLHWQRDDTGALSVSEAPGANGCSAEFTELEVVRQRWWTFGLEAFGDDKPLMDVLTAAMQAFSANRPWIEGDLRGVLSCGYPHWLWLVEPQAVST